MPHDSWSLRDRRPLDARRVSEAAEELDLCEFEVFRAAYRHWHTAEPDKKSLEKDFVGYLFHQRVPPYVRHYVRDVLPRGGGRTASDGLRRRTPLVTAGYVFTAAAFGLGLVVYVLFLA